MIDIDIQQELQSELMDNEKLLWTGRPRKGVVFNLSDIFYIPFSLIWTALVSYFFFFAHNQDGWSFYTFYIICFAIAGLYLVVGRFFYDSKRRSNTIYGITDVRVIIKSGIFSETLKSLYIEDLPELTIEEGLNGSGTIIFGPNGFKFYMLPGMGKFRREPLPSKLELINDAKVVYNMLFKLQKGLSDI